MSERDTQDVRSLRETVIQIRKLKLPDPAELGNAGSFFKNPVLPAEEFETLVQQYPDLPSYPGTAGSKKIPAAWLIEQCGWKGKRFGPTGIHEKQSLVLVNYGQASGRDILELADRISEDVKSKFGVHLIREVNVV